MEQEEKIQHVYKTSKTYPELAKGLIGIGVRSYTVDVVTGIILYRFDDGNDTLHLSENSRSVADTFNKEKTIQAVRDSQQGKITYPEFMEAIAASGVRFYEATLHGPKKRVTYIGKGGYYEELIPV